MSRHRMIWVGLALVAIAAGTSHAAITAAQKCMLAKQKASAKLVSDNLKCSAKGVKKGVYDPECIPKAEAKFAAAFVKAEANGECLDTGSAALVKDGLNTFVYFVQSATAQGYCGSITFPVCGGSCSLGSTCQTIYSGGFPLGCQCVSYL